MNWFYPVFFTAWSIGGLAVFIWHVDAVTKDKKLWKGILLLIAAGPATWVLFGLLCTEQFKERLKKLRRNRSS